MKENITVALVLMKSEEGEVTIELLEEQPGVRIHDHGTYWKVQADDEIRVRMTDVADRLGRPLVISQWLVIMASFVGRAHATDTEFVVSSEMTYLATSGPAESAVIAIGGVSS